MKMLSPLTLLLGLSAVGGLAGLAAGDGADKARATAQTPPPEAPPTGRSIDFTRDVYPVLQRACVECHGPDKQKGDFRLDSRAVAFKAGSGGAPAIVPGKPDESELVRRISLPKGSDEIMPSRGDPLTKVQIDAIREWVRQGAKWPEGHAPSQHWAYVKPARPSLPAVRDTA